MSRTYGFKLSCREVDSPRVRDFATAATREQSFKDLGYDLTGPEQEEKKGNSYFFVREEHHSLDWTEFSGTRKSLDVDGIMDRIVQAFPDVEFINS